MYVVGSVYSNYVCSIVVVHFFWGGGVNADMFIKILNRMESKVVCPINFTPTIDYCYSSLRGCDSCCLLSLFLWIFYYGYVK